MATSVMIVALFNPNDDVTLQFNRSPRCRFHACQNEQINQSIDDQSINQPTDNSKILRIKKKKDQKRVKSWCLLADWTD